MGNWRNFVSNICSKEDNVEALRAEAEKGYPYYEVYPRSINRVGTALLMTARGEKEKCLLVIDEDERLQELEGACTEESGLRVKVCPLSNENCNVIRKVFPYTNPQPHRGKNITIGLGDRLGIASSGHIETVRDFDVFPVLSQQSIRELNLTGRTYEDVISSAAWAVFQEGYAKDYGADGDHLKTAEEVKISLDAGMTMITLDCSEHMDNPAASADISELGKKYSGFTREERDRWERKYSGKDISIGGYRFHITEGDLIRMACVYRGAVRHTLDIYHNIIAKCGRPIDFEMSIDETLTPTSPASHYFLASELIDGGVEITSLAPKFSGEFQKGIDYIGDLKQFEEEFTIHAAIADYFGYKISVHSGSDKFKVFPIVGEKTNGKYHLKTAGTNWLEAVRVIARHKPDLYRRMHAFALEHLEEAKKYYHIGAKTENIPALEGLKDAELPDLMNKDDSRQVLHITYGLILQAKDENGKSLFKDELYSVLYEYEEEYAGALKKHIGRHLKGLGLL